MSHSIRKTASTLALTGVLLAALPALAQQDFSNVEIIPRHVAGNMYYLQGAGGNIGLSTAGPERFLSAVYPELGGR